MAFVTAAALRVGAIAPPIPTPMALHRVPAVAETGARPEPVSQSVDASRATVLFDARAEAARPVAGLQPLVEV